MNIQFPRTAIYVAIAAALLAGCATVPEQSTGAMNARSKLTQLQANPDLANRAAVAMKDADAAVRAAETPHTDQALDQHLVMIADRKIDTARALAETALAESQRTALNEQRERARLDSRTQEADAAKAQAASARADSALATLAAERSKADADAARMDAANSQLQAANLQLQIEEMNAKVTDRGVVLTLGDVLFTSGKADLKPASTGTLDKLARFLGDHPERTVMVEGHTDSVGGDDYNQGLSERRADGVKAYLVAQGVSATRLTAVGRGKTAAIADNASAEGRQQNRRVEVVISNAPTASL